jgi:16S rRNA processing protein RimM
VVDEKLVALGVVTRAHGVSGELRVKLFNPDSELLADQSEVVLRVKGDARPAQVVNWRPQGTDFLLLRIEGCASRNDAQSLRGAEVCVPRSALPEPAADEYYLVDLPGLDAFLPDGEPVGRIQEVVAYPSADVLLVQSSHGLIEVPMIEPYLVKVDISAGRVVINHLDDLGRNRPGRGDHRI